MTDLKPCPSCGELLDHPSGDGCANMTAHKERAMSDKKLIARLRRMSPRLDMLDCENVLTAADRIEALTEQLTAARQDAKEAEAKALRAAADMVASTAYTSNGDGRSLEPVSAGLVGMDMHHATISEAILALIPKEGAPATAQQPAPPSQRSKERDMTDETFYIDCEFDGHNGPLLSIAMVREDGKSTHITVVEGAEDPWVIENVVPVLSEHKADEGYNMSQEDVGPYLLYFMGNCQNPTIIADSPVDIGRFCRAISTGSDGGWQSTDFPQMTFIVRNVDCYPTTLEGAVQHNAWWDAMALRATLAEISSHNKGESHE